MTDTVRDAIATEIALLVQVVDFPEAPFGYGSDVWCERDVDPNVEEIDPFSTLGIAQSTLRRLDTPRGSLPDDDDYGLALRDFVNVGMTATEVASLAGRIRNEVVKDDRIDTATVTVTPTPDGSEIDILILITAVDLAIGEFSMTLNASDAGILMEAIGA